MSVPDCLIEIPRIERGFFFSIEEVWKVWEVSSLEMFGGSSLLCFGDVGGPTLLTTRLFFFKNPVCYHHLRRGLMGCRRFCGFCHCCVFLWWSF